MWSRTFKRSLGEQADPGGERAPRAGGCLHRETRTSDAVFAATAPEQAPAPPRPYQGVRVKEPVKELLRRKRGHASGATSVTPAAVSVTPAAVRAPCDRSVCARACVCVCVHVCVCVCVCVRGGPWSRGLRRGVCPCSMGSSVRG